MSNQLIHLHPRTQKTMYLPVP